MGDWLNFLHLVSYFSNLDFLPKHQEKWVREKYPPEKVWWNKSSLKICGSVISVTNLESTAQASFWKNFLKALTNL